MENKQLYYQPIIDKDKETKDAIRYVVNVLDTLNTICKHNGYKILNKYDENEYMNNSMTVDFEYKPKSNNVEIYVHPIILSFDKPEQLTDEVFDTIKRYMDCHFDKVVPMDDFKIYFMVNPKKIKLGEEYLEKPYARYVYSQIKSNEQESRGTNLAEGDKIITPFTIRYEFNPTIERYRLKLIKETSRQSQYVTEILNLFSTFTAVNC